MWPNLAFGLLLLMVSLALLFEHRASWRRAQIRDLEVGERDFLHQRYRHRMQTSALIGVAGVLVIVGHWVQTPRAALSYWLGVLLLMLFFLVSASADWRHSHRYYHELRRRIINEREALQAQLKYRRIAGETRADGNGHPNDEQD